MLQKILDVCCGGRMMWFNKHHPLAIFMDKEKKEKGCIEQQKNFEVNPDIIGDFRDIPYDDNTFKLVVFDPPHAFLSDKSIMGIKYGSLDKDNWEDDLKRGFDECIRVLEPYGVLIFKWNEVNVSIKDVIIIFGKEPLFGHTTAKSGSTKWMCFMKDGE